MNRSTAPIHLAWAKPAQLEIQYSAAMYIHIYKPVFFWGSSGSSRSIASTYINGSYSPIFVRASQIDNRTVNASPN